MPATDPIAVAIAYFDGWNRHDADRIAATLDANVVYDSDANGVVRGPDGFRAFAGVFLSAFPDLAFDVRPYLLSGDRVVAQWTVSGTHQAPVLGLPASGRRFTLHGCDVIRVEGGRITHVEAYWDSATLVRQISIPDATPATSADAPMARA